MEPTLSEWLNLIFRWIHVLAGVMWIGHLWFFNFVNSQLAKTYTPEGKKQVLPELMPRALYWFRWGAAYTWVTGVLLLWVVYWSGNAMGSDKMSSYASGGILVAIIIVCFGIYDVLWKQMMKNEMAGTVVSFILLAGFLLLARYAFGIGGRALFIYTGALFGTIMFANVWMRIWPYQRKIIAGVKGTAPAPEANIPAVAGMRSKHNTYMSFPLIFFMVSNHFPTVYGSDWSWVIALIFVIVGWIITKLLYGKSATPAPAQF
jgi:uncharacterized membrane protein